MNQIGENGKKNLVLGLSLAHLAQIQTANPPPPLKKIWLHQLLDVMVSFHQAQHQKKLITQS